ncbi:MAG: SpoIID/LytB domain-containing protein [Bdellovibrionota bacterium]|jgi:stage II sporulation protein D
MVVYKMYEAAPTAVRVPQVEPIIRVGIVLEEDKKDFIEFIPQDDLLLSTSAGEEFLFCGAEKCNLKYRLTLHNGLSVLSLDGEELGVFTGSLKLKPLQEKPLVAGSGIKLENIVAGRGFHWQKEIAQTFPGTIEIIPSLNYFVVVNVIGIEFYTVCALASEMSGENSLTESGRAQATAARSWAYVFLGSKYTDKPYQICNDDFSQRYQGTTHLSDRVIDLVTASRGDYIVLNNGYVAPSNYSKSCGGHMESTQALFGYDAGHPEVYLDSPNQGIWSEDLREEAAFLKWLDAPREHFFCGMIPDQDLKQYLGAVDEKGEYFRWNHTTTSSTIIKKLKEKCGLDDVVAISDLKGGKRGVSGRFLTMEIVYIDKKGQKQVASLGDQFYIRACLHETFLFSSAFVFTLDRDAAGNVEAVHFRGAGWGHGGGFCQIGAVGMALAGYSYPEIIKHYYPKAEIVKAY